MIRFDPSVPYEFRPDPESPPTFLLRPLSARQAIRFAELQDAAIAADQGGGQVTGIGDCVRVALAGWRDVTDPDSGDPAPFDPGRLEDVVSTHGLRELYREVRDGLRPQDAPDPKPDGGAVEPGAGGASTGDPSASPSPSPSASSAPAAAPAAAPTGPPPPSPCASAVSAAAAAAAPAVPTPDTNSSTAAPTP